MRNNTLRHIRVLSDGRPGHENQSVGLAMALADRTGATYELVRINPAARLGTRLRSAAARLPETGGEPAAWDLVIAAGHRTHLPLWWAARRLSARSVVIMKPSLPLAFFDLALVPHHDVAASSRETTRRILTRGALNRLPERLPPKTPSGLVLVGGPSKHHGWDGAGLAALVAGAIAGRPDLEWMVVDSRRTPEGFLADLVLPTAVRKVPHAQTGPGWLAGELARAALVWATEDSVSMVHEAVTAGAATGVLPVPAAKRGGGGRPALALAGLVNAGLVTLYPVAPTVPPGRFHETGRCADLIVARWYS